MPPPTELLGQLLLIGVWIHIPQRTGVEALFDPALADLAMEAVLGLHSPHRQEIEELVVRSPTPAAARHPRLAMAMLGPQEAISLRQAIAGDETLLSYWANDPQVRATSFSQEPIAPKNHHHWFQKGLTDANRLWLIATTADGCPIGQIRFDRKPASSQADASEAAVDLSLDRSARGNGLAADLVRLGLQVLEQRWGPAPETVAEVLSSKNVSNGCFVRAGFPSNSKLLSESHTPASEVESLALAPGRITLLSDRDSWLNAFLPDLISALWQRGHAVRWIHTPSALCSGDVCLLLSCGRLLSSQQLALHRHNLVVHGSALPQGQGWSPMTWQILEGAAPYRSPCLKLLPISTPVPFICSRRLHSRAMN